MLELDSGLWLQPLARGRGARRGRLPSVSAPQMERRAKALSGCIEEPLMHVQFGMMVAMAAR